MKDLILQNAPAVETAKMRTSHCLHLTFLNGYGASIIDDGYGSDEGLYELAVLDTEGHITRETPITNDVIGWLTRGELVATLNQIADLPMPLPA